MLCDSQKRIQHLSEPKSDQDNNRTYLPRSTNDAATLEAKYVKEVSSFDCWIHVYKSVILIGECLIAAVSLSLNSYYYWWESVRNEYYYTVVIAIKKLSTSEAKPSCWVTLKEG